MIIDFHTHFLPRIDDGSQSVEESIAMLQQEYGHEVRNIVATPHFYAQKDSVDAFITRRQKSFQRIKEAIEEQNSMPDLHISLGAEVYYFRGIGDAAMLPQLCIQGTDTLLLEMPFCQWETEMLRDIKKMIQERQITVVLAHIERYLEYQKDMHIWNEIFDLPVYAQINAGSFLKWKKRRRCLDFIREGYEVVLGSDCHNMTSRQPNLAEAREVIEKKLGSQILEEIDTRTERLLG